MSGKAIDIGLILDDGPFSSIQKLAVLLASLAAVLDGFDGQLIGFADPAILREWGMTREAFAPIVAAGLLGMAIGSVSVGAVADRVGRRVALIASISIFGTATLAMGFSSSPLELGALRFIAGLGIGGALPTASIIAVEFTPARMRTLAVTATVVCYPVGGIVAGILSAMVLPNSGWRSLFFLGGLLPLAFTILLALSLPESPRYLARRAHRQEDLRRLLARMRGPIPEGALIVDATKMDADAKMGLTNLFTARWIRDTAALSGAFFMCLLALYSAFSWLPAMLAFEGLDIGIASHGLTAYNVGGLVGALLCAGLVSRFGSRVILAIAALGAMLTALLLQARYAHIGVSAFIVGIGVHGFFVNAVQGPMYALGAHLYPTEIRARGVGAATAFGRLGAIVSAFAGAAVISLGGAAAYFTLLALAMLFALTCICVIRNHIPARKPHKLPEIVSAE
ncbi:MFS transporter [Cupriavidus lacunae]|uniref:MFS transporter n=1 Tax=Cupriavidus lacunae TaxID=2666307 RepID=A0A370MWU3_9BURK|nr:MFS transporter [Cupriavidus lacunae]RDJ97802.1 MFS transporter [Cupriavidus lacunae]